MQSNEINILIRHLSKMPGLGPRSGRRAALHLIKNKETALAPLIASFQDVYNKILTCQNCGNLDVSSVCSICMDSSRDEALLCIVEDVVDIWAVERTGYFKGRYFVLGGVLSVINGIGPNDLSFDLLLHYLNTHKVSEVIIALNSTMDGQTTSFYVKDILSHRNIKISSLAQGVPVGGELDYLDDSTLMTALHGRREL